MLSLIELREKSYPEFASVLISHLHDHSLTRPTLDQWDLKSQAQPTTSYQDHISTRTSPTQTWLRQGGECHLLNTTWLHLPQFLERWRDPSQVVCLDRRRL